MLRVLAVLLAFLALNAPARADETAAWQALRDGGIALIRHAIAPGTGDPAGMRLNDCATQRNLDAVGRAQASRLGERFRANGVIPGAVLTSQWCRTRETAAIAFPSQGRDTPAFNSFFDDRAQSAARTAEGLSVLRAWTGPGALVVVTHQVNITALTGIVPASGETIVVRLAGERPLVIGRIPF